MGVQVSKLALTAGWAGLIAIQAGVALDFNGTEAKRFLAPAQPQALAFGVIWSTIFLAQGIGAILPWCGQRLSDVTAPFLSRVGGPWLSCWAFQSAWTVLQHYLLGPWGGEPRPVGRYSVSLAFLVGSYVSMVVAARTSVQALQGELKKKNADPGWPRRLHLTLGNLFYVFPSALNAGWLGLATVLGILQLKLATGATYTDAIPLSTALLPIAAATTAVVPWVLPLTPASLSKKGVNEALLANQYSPPGSIAGSSAAVPVGKKPAGLGVWAQAVSGVVVGAAGYASAIAWGLGNILPADRPEQVKSMARVLLGVAPVVSALGVAGRIWLANKKAA